MNVEGDQIWERNEFANKLPFKHAGMVLDDAEMRQRWGEDERADEPNQNGVVLEKMKKEKEGEERVQQPKLKLQDWPTKFHLVGFVVLNKPSQQRSSVRFSQPDITLMSALRIFEWISR